MLKKYIKNTLELIYNPSPNIKEKIEVLKVDEERVTIDIHQIEALIDTKILTQEDWKNFRKQFVKLYPFFFTSLKAKDVLLTKSEERLLALEYLNLSTHEIAGRLGVSDRSVIVSRYRLRKKTKAPKGTPILEYLNLK
ncbi:hypothetical protein Q4Q34_03895 [Flavivirga abyssicola]|uniref:helix-turn-helix transcriptional regulator n=1 Tax=Flavivirga abyssicola TaxID=3063533 RepID=UPI0026E00722|nr:hypothetical protein [Flavivirga sp. MEBiC07777]WVK14172.1 hypothetical protein Q4Q34_03895 [Flavivirga sp. MEBiC07777]